MADRLFEAARDYAARGWPVLPLRPRDKPPLTRHGLLDATTKPEIIEHWWDQWPEANVGLRTGIAFDVLDIDGPAGLESMRSFSYTHEGPVSQTGKGYHLLFGVTGAKNGAAMRPGLDFRGDGGYIVAPPSIHPLGHAYAWMMPPSHYKLPEPPDWLLDMVMPKPPAPPKERGALSTALAAMFPQPGSAAVTQHMDTEGELAKLGTALQPLGKRRTGRCPFHEDSTPSLTVYPDDTFYCFGCQAWGDALNVANYRLRGALR